MTGVVMTSRSKAWLKAVPAKKTTMAEPPSAFHVGDYGLPYQDRYHYARDFRHRQDRDGVEEMKETKKESQPSPFNMTAKNFPKKRNHIRSSIASYNRTRGSTYGGNKALELVRAALQPALNAEIEAVLKSYQEMFKMAAHNVKDNTGETVTEEQINCVIRKSLEEAKLMFRVDGRGTTEKIKYERSERSGSPSVVRKKRPRLDPDNRSSPLSKNTESKTICAYEWNPDSITDDTEFVMGVKANKALGFAATRGKLYYRHPQLFKYSGDSDDKQWLYDQTLLPITGGKAFLMIADEVRTLVETHEDYKDNENIKIDDLKGFKVPDAMREKMKAYMRKMKREAIRRRTEQKQVSSRVDEDVQRSIPIKTEPVSTELESAATPQGSTSTDMGHPGQPKDMNYK